MQTEDTFQIVIERTDGALSTVTTAFGMQKYRGPAVEVYGLEGTLQMMGDDSRASRRAEGGRRSEEVAPLPRPGIESAAAEPAVATLPSHPQIIGKTNRKSGKLLC